jgi:hypothetical protein
LASGHTNNLGCSECQEAIYQRDAALDFGGLAVRASCRDVFIEGLEVPHHPTVLLAAIAPTGRIEIELSARHRGTAEGSFDWDALVRLLKWSNKVDPQAWLTWVRECIADHKSTSETS